MSDSVAFDLHDDSHYVYAIGPIDFWFGWHRIDEFLAFQSKGDGTSPTMDPHSMLRSPGVVEEVARRLMVVSGIAARHGWEGRVRHGDIYVAGFPGPDGHVAGDFLIGWKQDNNGTTFIASRHPLPHLDGSRIYPARKSDRK